MMANGATENLADEGRAVQLAPLDGEDSRASGILERANGGGVYGVPAEAVPAEAAQVASPVGGSAPGEPVSFPSENVASGGAGSGAVPVTKREAGEREASPLASAMQLGKDRDEDIEITTDDAEHPSVTAAAEDDAIEVSDDEIETAEAELARATQPSPSSSFAVARSRPPMPPSLRPRPPSSVPLPPPRSGSLPPSGRMGVDPWVLANKTLELSHARARIAELEELVAFRDARILELEENLARARRKPGELGPLSSTPSPGAASALEAPVITQTRPAVTAYGALSESPPLAGPAAFGAPPMALDGDEADEDEDEERDSAFDGVADVHANGAHGVTGSEEDLQQISGIGPRYEAALRRQGITRLSQIAAWSESDVRQVAKALKIPKSRIVKGRWVEVAREVIGTRAASE